VSGGKVAEFISNNRRSNRRSLIVNPDGNVMKTVVGPSSNPPGILEINPRIGCARNQGKDPRR
jgi:hypothetical protein